jgi:hypothetical protein
MIMSNYLFMEPIGERDMGERVPVGINHITVVPENVERSTRKESGDGGDDEE